MSPTDAGMSASNGADRVLTNVLPELLLFVNIPIQNPCIALAADSEAKLVTSAAQKHETANPSVVIT
jgi:hypothetical protein